MSNFHRHSAWGRVRRPKNILGVDRTLIAGNVSSDVVDNTDPVDDLVETISNVSLNTTTRIITFTTADSIGTNVFDGATGFVITAGFHPLFDNRPMAITSTNDGSNQTSARVPSDITSGQLLSLSVNPQGTLVQQTTHGVRTENARFLHLFFNDTGDNSETISLFGYNYAFGQWAPLTIASKLDGSVADAYKAVSFTITDASQMHVIPINGIDKVYFKIGTDRSTVRISAAISTF